MRHRLFLGLGLAFVLVLMPIAAEAQVCVRGKPCGNTCIARNRTCRVGQGTARQGGSPAPAAGCEGPTEQTGSPPQRE